MPNQQLSLMMEVRENAGTIHDDSFNYSYAKLLVNKLAHLSYSTLATSDCDKRVYDLDDNQALYTILMALSTMAPFKSFSAGAVSVSELPEIVERFEQFLAIFESE